MKFKFLLTYYFNMLYFLNTHFDHVCFYFMAIIHTIRLQQIKTIIALIDISKMLYFNLYF